MRVFFALALLTTPLAQAALPEFLPPDTKVVVGFSMRSFLESPLLSSFGPIGKTAAPFLSTSPLKGIDPLKDIDELLFTSTGGASNAPALIVIHGRFGALAASATHEYHGVPIHENSKTPNSNFALLDSSTLLGGDLALVHAAIDRRGQPLSINPALLARIQAFDGVYDFWAVGEVPQGLRSTTMSSPEMQAIDRFEFGASLRNGLDLVGQIHVRNTKDAEKLMQTLKLVELMLAMQPKSNTGTKFELSSDNDTLKLALFIPEEELKKTMQGQMSRFASLGGAPGGAAPGPKVSDTAPGIFAPVITAPEPKLPPLPGAIVKNERGDAVTVTLPRK